MTNERNEEILNAGFKAACAQMCRHPQRPDYPRDFDRLYEWLEDKVFNLYEAVCLKKYSHVKIVSADIVVTACEFVEFAETKEQEEMVEQWIRGGSA